MRGQSNDANAQAQALVYGNPNSEGDQMINKTDSQNVEGGDFNVTTQERRDTEKLDM